jgi:hypothetical protein
MSPNKPASDAQKAKAISVKDPDNLTGTMKRVGGSRSDQWNETLANQALRTLWTAHSKDEALSRQYNAVVAALVGIEPRDEIEAMIAAQLLGAHNAAMECYRRAMLKDQTFEGYREYLNQANKLSRTHAVLLDALNRHRGKGQQKVTVEHVHVHSGGQAIVGTIESPAVDSSKPAGQNNAKEAGHAPQPEMRSPNAEPELVPSASDAERPLPDARRNVAGSTEGQ